MEWTFLILTTFFAATLQAATGFGFGLVGVTIFVILLQSTSAVQIVIIVTFAMSVFHWLKIRSHAPDHLVKKIMLGCMVGYPIGVLIFSNFDLYALKLSVALLILVVSAQNLFEILKTRRGGTPNFLPMRGRHFAGVGAVSGIMASALAMPGPPVIAYLAQCELDKNAIRATVITCSTFSYGVALILQASFIGIDTTTMTTSAILIPIALIGTLFGDYIARFINPTLFKNIVLVVLLFSGLNMVINL
ncbi:UPF0721 transmembrane protein [Pseudovibrio japonicus]|uniref:Probable membrane transporter protein n=2 Tax=Pseudovibrio japonicus TaxID=366534 RepID=A0ABQ3EPJ1_9HYPH|nr:UPF0721 transmembrane protein [Pseudovibrio japonicus]